MTTKVAAAEKIAAMQTEEFFLARRNRADREAFRRILNRQTGEAPAPEDAWDPSDSEYIAPSRRSQKTA